MNRNKVARFQIRHALLFSGIFIFILIAFVILIAQQNHEYTKYDAVVLQKYFQRFKNHIESKFFYIESNLRRIKISAEADLFESRENGLRFPFAYKFMKEKPRENYFHMDDIIEPYRKNIHINITGNGSLHNRSARFYRVLKMGLNLSDDFYAFRESFPNLIYIYYLSTEKLMVHNPWFPSDRLKFEESLYDYDLWKLSTPQKNPKRNVFWTSAYIDSNAEGGLITSCAVPVYDDDVFVGVIGADLTVDFMNAVVAEFEPQRKGCMVIFDQDQNMLAYPDLISFKDKTIRKLKDSLPPELAADLNMIMNAPENRIITAGKWNFIKSVFSNAPFSTLYYFPRQTPLNGIIEQLGYGTLGLIVCMLFLVSASLFITYRKLIHPTEKFVNFILAKSQGSKAAHDSKIPDIWKTWFLTIEKVFDENATLTEDIKQRNIELQNEIEAKIKAEIEKANLEKQLIQEEKIRAIGLLAGGIAHDFNNQLSIINGYAGILLSAKSLSEEKRKECLNNILSATSSAADLTRQLLAFAQKGNYHSVPVNMHEIIMEVISIFNHTIDKRITIKNELEAALHTTQGDLAQLQNMIMNIAINAKNAMPGGGRITFKTINETLTEENCNQSGFELAHGNYVKILISDTGTGIDEETKKHIFEPFFTTNNSGGGTGLGLAAALGTIKNHKGSIAVESTVDQGSTFIIELPVLDENVSSKKMEQDEKIKATETGAKLLLIDDEEAFCRMMTDFMGAIGYTVIAFCDPFSAIEYYRKSWREIDLVITDMMMPKISGHDLIKELSGINPMFKVVISSGYSTEKETSELLKSKQVLAFYKKPFNLAQFAHDISNLLEK